MSYDTKHVRNASDPPGTITSIPTFTELLGNPDLASIYTSIHQSAPTTAPELTETAAVSKKTVYEYLRRLEQAGLITETERDDGPSVYDPEEFEMTLTVQDVEVSITPALIEVVAHADEYPIIKRVLDDHGLVSFALANDLANAHSTGDITLRQIARLTGLSSGTAYDIVEALYHIHGLGDDDPGPTTFTPDDVADEDGELRDALLDDRE